MNVYDALMTADSGYVPFSLRHGLASVPPQLKPGEVSEDLRRLIDHHLCLEVKRHIKHGYSFDYFEQGWRPLVQDFYIYVLRRGHDEVPSYANIVLRDMRDIIREATIGDLFDFVEFFVRHHSCGPVAARDIASAFVSARAAYRIIDGQILAIGTAEQGLAFERALSQAEVVGAEAARSHLMSAGLALRNGDWPGSVRESIHAVEAMALRLAPGAKTLGPALAAIERSGHLHGSLKAAFGALYGYSCDEEGVRHSLVFQKEAQVDEADALFMLGACASFVSYLASRLG